MLFKLYIAIILTLIYLELRDSRKEVRWRLKQIVKKLLKHERCDQTPSVVELVLIIDGEEVDHTMAKILRSDKDYKLSVKGKDAKGNDAALDPAEPAKFSLSDESFGSISSDDNGSTVLKLSGKLGLVTIQAQDDGLTVLGECEVVAGSAVSLEMGIEEVSEAPAPETPVEEKPAEAVAGA